MNMKDSFPELEDMDQELAERYAELVERRAKDYPEIKKMDPKLAVLYVELVEQRAKDYPEIKKMDPKLAVLYVSISDDVMRLHLTWCEYVTLYGTNDHFEVMNKTTPRFFRILHIGLGENVTLFITRLTDCPRMSGHENLSIRQFLELIQDVELKEKVETLICRAEKAAKPCREWRNRWHAHRSMDVALGEAELLPLKLKQDMRDAIDAITEVRDVIGSHYESTSTRSIPEWSGATVLLEILGKHLKTQDESLEAKRQLRQL